jgi:hypothetical protein
MSDVSHSSEAQGRAPFVHLDDRVVVRGRSSSHATLVRWTAFLVAFLIVTLLVLQQSYAAFSTSTADSGNTITAATITLTDNDGNGAMYANLTGVIPGQTYDRCITVTYTGAVAPTAVTLYASAAPTGTLGTYLDLTVDMGTATADPFGTCTNFTSTQTVVATQTLATFAATNNAYATGVATWTPTVGTTSRTFRFRMTVQNNDLAQNQTASNFGFTWEARTP